jgi:RNA polymerase sigma-70 factor, ECF subfamily
MSVGITTPVAEPDPVAAALADPAVGVRLRNAALAYLGARGYAQDAADVVQEAVARVLKRCHAYDPTRDVVCWLVGFVVNVARERVKPHGRAPTAGPPLDTLADDLRPVAEAVADRELATRLIRQLSPGEQELVELVYTERLTFAEIGERLGLTVTAARVRHHRTLKHLKALAGVGEVRP